MAISPERYQVATFPTPLVSDVLFFEVRDANVPGNQVPPYGTSHPNVRRWPNHKLVMVEPTRDGGKTQNWWYAADRSSQDTYNWSFSDADIGGRKFRAVVREYIVTRDTFNPESPTMGAAMPDEPAGKFAGEYILASREQLKTGSERIDSVYVLERRTYVKRVDISALPYDAGMEVQLPRLESLYYRGEQIDGTAIESLVADEDNAFWGLQDDLTARSCEQLTDNWFVVSEQVSALKRGADESYSRAWPTGQRKIRGSEASIPARYLDQVSTKETITKEVLPAALVDDIPEPDDPVGNVARNLHEKLSDKHYRKTVLEHEFDLDTSLEDIEVEVRPYVTITTRARGGLSSELPATGSGSSQLLWKAGDQTLYENRDIDSVGRPGLKGYDVTAQQWGSYKEQTDYSANPEPEPGGSSRVIYDDGETTMYEVTNLIEVTVNGISVDKDPQAWGTAEWRGTYSLEEGVDSDRTRVIWQRADYKVYLNEDVTPIVSGGTIDKDPQLWGTLRMDGIYATELDPEADESRQIWRVGDQRVFLNKTASIEVSGTTRDKDAQSWGYLTWDGTYSEVEDAGADRSRQVYRIGNLSVFLNENVTVEVSGGTRDTDPQQWGSITWVGLYELAQDTTAERSRQVWRLGENTVFLNERITVEVDGTTLDKDPQPWGTIRWEGIYATEENQNADRTRQVWRLNEYRVFLNETAILEISGDTLDKDPQLWGFATWRGEYASTRDPDADRSRQVFRIGTKSVYLNEYVQTDISGGTRTKDAQPWGTVTFVGTYGEDEDLGADRSRQLWRVGDNSVYLNETATIEIDGETVDVDLREWGNLRWEGTYATQRAGDRSRQVFKLGSNVVYLNEEVFLENVGGTTKTVDPQQWGSLFWDGSYSLEASTADGDRSRQVFKIKDSSVFLNETPTASILPTSFTSFRDENILMSETHTASYGTEPIEGTNTQSRVVFSLGDIRVYENISIVRQSKGPRTYQGTTIVDIPPILTSINPVGFTMRSGETKFYFDVQTLSGINGYMPASVEEVWSEEPGDSETPTNFRPEAISFGTPWGSVNVPPTLHPGQSINITVGTRDPVFDFQVHTITIGTTDPADYRGLNILAKVESLSYRNGYIIRKYRVQL